jgi:hypothetical protein
MQYVKRQILSFFGSSLLMNTYSDGFDWMVMLVVGVMYLAQALHP